MMPVLPDLEAELRRAGDARLAERQVTAPVPAPTGRRRRTLAVLLAATVGIVLAAGVGVAAITGTPIDQLLRSPQDYGQRPGTPRVDLPVRDPGGLRWTVTGYVARNGLVSTTAAPAGLHRLPGMGGGSQELLAAARRAGDYVGVSTTDALVGPTLHRLVSGLADGDVARIDVTIGGHRRRAQLSEGRLDLAKGLVERVYAVGFVFANPRHHRQIGLIRFDVTLKDGRHATSWSPPQCLGACGGSMPRVP